MRNLKSWESFAKTSNDNINDRGDLQENVNYNDYETLQKLKDISKNARVNYNSYLNDAIQKLEDMNDPTASELAKLLFTTNTDVNTQALTNPLRKQKSSTGSSGLIGSSGSTGSSGSSGSIGSSGSTGSSASTSGISQPRDRSTSGRINNAPVVITEPVHSADVKNSWRKLLRNFFGYTQRMTFIKTTSSHKDQSAKVNSNFEDVGSALR